MKSTRVSIFSMLTVLGAIVVSCSKPETKTISMAMPASGLDGERTASIVDARLDDYGLSTHSVRFDRDSLYLTVPIDADEAELTVLTDYSGTLSLAPVIKANERGILEHMTQHADSLISNRLLDNGYNAVYAYDESEKTKIDTWLASPEIMEIMPDDIEPRWTIKSSSLFGPDEDHEVYKLYLIDTRKMINVDITDSAYGEADYIYCSIELGNDSSQQFARLTADNIGRPLAIIVDGVVLSAPTVNCPIESGRMQITGDHTMITFKALSAALNNPYKD